MRTLLHIQQAQLLSANVKKLAKAAASLLDI